MTRTSSVHLRIGRSGFRRLSITGMLLLQAACTRTFDGMQVTGISVTRHPDNANLSNQIYVQSGPFIRLVLLAPQMKDMLQPAMAGPTPASSFCAGGPPITLSTKPNLSYPVLYDQNGRSVATLATLHGNAIARDQEYVLWLTSRPLPYYAKQGQLFDLGSNTQDICVTLSTGTVGSVHYTNTVTIPAETVSQLVSSNRQ